MHCLPKTKGRLMPKKSLYREEDERYTDETLRLDIEAHEALEPIFKKYKELGYKVREIGSVVHFTVFDLELEEVMNLKI